MFSVLLADIFELGLGLMRSRMSVGGGVQHQRGAWAWLGSQLGACLSKLCPYGRESLELYFPGPLL